jgi:hypothetical protein
MKREEYFSENVDANIPVACATQTLDILAFLRLR